VTIGRTLYNRSLDTGAQTAVGSIENGDSVISWSANSRDLFLQRDTAEGRTAEILRMDLHTGKKELWRELRPADPGAYIFGPVSMTPDEKSFAFSYQRDLETLYLVKGVK
jgi:hypothetical protein